MLLAVLAESFLAKRIKVAKLYRFENDRERLVTDLAVLGQSSPMAQDVIEPAQVYLGLEGRRPSEPRSRFAVKRTAITVISSDWGARPAKAFTAS
jgi:hypothetical protein